MLNSSKIISNVFIFAISFTLFSMVGNAQTIRLINSDMLEGKETTEGLIREYRGNVKLQHGDVKAKSETAFQYFAQNRAELMGNVIIIQNDMTLKSPEIIYDGNTGIARTHRNIIIVDSNVTLKASRGVYNTNNYIADFEDKVEITDASVTITSNKAKYNRHTLESDASGNVIIDEDSARIFSDFLHYNRNSRESRNYGNVIVKGKYSNVYLTGDTLINFPKKSYTYSTGQPVFFQIDSVQKNEDGLYFPESYKKSDYKYDTLTISADTMESLSEAESEKYIFTGNVEIIKGNMYAAAFKAIYFKSNEMFFLEGNPVIWFDSTQLHADSIIVYLPDNELKMIHSIGNALAASRDDTLNPERKNQIIGSSIKIFFNDKKIQQIESTGDAKSLYFMSSEQGNDGADRTSCDTVYVNFAEGKPDEVIWLGAVDGKFYPENLVWDKVKDYFLPNFRWRDKKPGKKVLKLGTRVRN